MTGILRRFAAALLLTIGLIGSAAAADESGGSSADAKFFAGKTVRIIVGFAAGGGTDIQARHFASRWGEFIPGKPRVTVTNITPDIAATNLVYESKPDGLTLLFAPSAYVVEQFIDAQTKFDMSKMRIIGSHNGSSSVLMVRKDFPYKTMKENVGGKTVMRVGAIRPDSGFTMRIAAMSQWLDIPVKFVSGVAGTSQGLIGLERNDIDGYLAGGGGGPWYSLPFIRPGWFKDGTVRAWGNLGPSDVKIGPNAELPAPDVPYVPDLLKDPHQKELYDIFAKVDAGYGKVLMAPPKTPDAVVDALRQSYAALLQDAVFRKKLEEIMGEPTKITLGDAIEPDLRRLVKAYADHAKEYEQWIEWAKERF
jgi:tripartite-type tricarboxylate transporter receptor subunit TctC